MSFVNEGLPKRSFRFFNTFHRNKNIFLTKPQGGKLPQLIDLSSLNSNTTAQTEATSNSSDYLMDYIGDIVPESDEVSLETLMQLFPKKLLFSIEEISDFLNVSYEFIRERTLNGKIPFTQMGNRRLINILTLHKLINNGTN